MAPQWFIDLNLVLDFDRPPRRAGAARLSRRPLFRARRHRRYRARGQAAGLGASAPPPRRRCSAAAWLGLLVGIGVALVFSGIHGLASINFKGNQTISGVALNFLAAGLTTFLGQSWFHRGGYTPQLQQSQRFTPISCPSPTEVQGRARSRRDLFRS